MGDLVLLVTKSVLGRCGACGERGIVILSDLLVGLLRSLGARTLDGLGNVSGGIGGGVGGGAGDILGPGLIRRSVIHKIGTNLDSVHFELMFS